MVIACLLQVNQYCHPKAHNPPICRKQNTVFGNKVAKGRLFPSRILDPDLLRRGRKSKRSIIGKVQCNPSYYSHHLSLSHFSHLMSFTAFVQKNYILKNFCLIFSMICTLSLYNFWKDLSLKCLDLGFDGWKQIKMAFHSDERLNEEEAKLHNFFIKSDFSISS